MESLQLTEEFLENRRKLQEIEAEIRRITADTKRWENKEDIVERIERLVFERWLLLRDMFLGTPSEVARFERVNARLYDLTKKMYRHGAAYYRQLLTNPSNPDFDDEKNFECSLEYAYNGEESVLLLEEDEIYGSDFASMIEVIDSLRYAKKRLGRGYLPIEHIIENYDANRAPNMTDEELGFEDTGDDGESWGHMSPVAHPELEHLFVHHAAYRACSEDFSLQDLLRMNDFWIEIHITHQHIVDQEGCKCGWWQDCTFEEFRRKMESEADHRPKGWSRGQFISKRCRQAILEDEDFRSENDPLYDDGKIDEFLSDVFAELHRPHENHAKSNR